MERDKEPYEDKVDVKTLRLCGEVARTLSAVFSGTCGDEVLQDLEVVSVIPAPNAGRLLVTVRWAGTPGEVDPRDILEHLERARGMLRSEVATSIMRKRTPELTYRLAGPEEVKT